MKEELLNQARHTGRLTGTRIQMTIPSILKEEEKFALRIAVTGPDALPFGGLSNPLVFEECGGVEGLPESIRLEKGRWSYTVAGLQTAGAQMIRIGARVKDSGNSGGDPRVFSNPAWVFERPPYRLYWGDLHVHTTFSNCHAWECVDPEWCYQYARETSLLDFAAAADHLRGIAAEEGRWARLQALARQYNQPGTFVTFLAFESSHAQDFGGDNNVYFADDGADHFWIDREDMHGSSPQVHLKELWEQLDAKGRPYISIPHHTGRRGKYRHWEEDYYNPGREPLFEIFSGWGSSETRWNAFPMAGGNNNAPSYYVEALKAGARFGVIASSDDHATLPGGQNNHRGEAFSCKALAGYPHKGLAALRAPDLSRGALFEAMKRRDAYATTFARSLVDVRVGGASMGREIKADAALRKKRVIRARFTLEGAGGARVTLMRNGEAYDHQTAGGKAAGSQIDEAVFEDAQPLEDIAVRGAKFHPDPFAVYYVRIRDSQGSHQWTSPVWVDL